MWERNINRLPLICTPTRDRAHNPGMCPDEELNQGRFASQNDTQPTKTHWSGPQQLLRTLTGHAGEARPARGIAGHRCCGSCRSIKLSVAVGAIQQQTQLRSLS